MTFNLVSSLVAVRPRNYFPPIQKRPSRGYTDTFQIRLRTPSCQICPRNFPKLFVPKRNETKKKQLNYKSKRKGVERLRVQSKQRRRLKFHRKHGVSVTCTCHLCVCAYVPPPVPGSVPRSRWSASCCTSSRRTWSPIASSDTRWSTAGGGGGQVESWWYGMKGKIIMSTKNIRENLNSIFGKQLS